MFALVPRISKNKYTVTRHFRTRRCPGSVSAPTQNGSSTGKLLVFTVGTTATFYTVASICEYGRRNNPRSPNLHSQWFPSIQQQTRKRGTLRQQMNDWWRRQSEGNKIFYPLLGINVLVLLAGKNARLSRSMSHYFLNSTHSSNASLLLSCFNHQSLIHLGCNMIVLQSFCDPAIAVLGRECFLATYLSAGVISSVSSQCFKVISGLSIPSLGASGAIMAILGLVCTSFPESKLRVIFLPMFDFSAGGVMKTLIAFDALGLLLRWRFIDHAAHLGGAFFGVAFAVGGGKLYDKWYSTVSGYLGDIREK